MFHLMVVGVWRWWHRIGGDGIDVRGPDDSDPCAPIVLHTHADADSNASDDPHDEHDSKHDAGNCSAREDISDIRIVGATVRRGPVTAVRSTLFATLGKAIVCVDQQQQQPLWKQEPGTPGQPPCVHPSR